MDEDIFGDLIAANQRYARSGPRPFDAGRGAARVGGVGAVPRRYVAGWSNCDAETIKATAANVLRAAHALADALTEQPEAVAA